MADLTSRVAQLEADIDKLEAALQPLLLDENHATNALRLPLLDKAKLHVLSTYALESTLFCGLSLADVDARNHAVHTELTRVRQYMAKIAAAEKGEDAAGDNRTAKLDKSAAIRFVRANVDDASIKSQLSDVIKAESEKAKAAEKQAKGSASSRTPSPGSTGNRRHHAGGKKSRGGKGSHHHPYPRGSRPA